MAYYFNKDYTEYCNISIASTSFLPTNIVREKKKQSKNFMKHTILSNYDSYNVEQMTNLSNKNASTSELNSSLKSVIINATASATLSFLSLNLLTDTKIKQKCNKYIINIDGNTSVVNARLKNFKFEYLLLNLISLHNLLSLSSFIQLLVSLNNSFNLKLKKFLNLINELKFMIFHLIILLKCKNRFTILPVTILIYFLLFLIGDASTVDQSPVGCQQLRVCCSGRNHTCKSTVKYNIDNNYNSAVSQLRYSRSTKTHNTKKILIESNQKIPVLIKRKNKKIGDLILPDLIALNTRGERIIRKYRKFFSKSIYIYLINC